MHNLSINAATAIATYGVLLHTGAAARREFCIAVVGEAVETGASFDDIASAAKLAVDYDGLDTAERDLFRKQVQYCRAIVAGWSKLGKRNQQAFVGGGLPASSAVKALKAKATPAAATDAAPEAVKVSQEGPSLSAAVAVIGGADHLIGAANFLDGANAATMSEAESKAFMLLLDAVADFKARTVEGATLKIAA